MQAGPRLNHQGCIVALRLGSALFRSRLLSCLRRTTRPANRPSLGVPLLLLLSRFAPARDLPHMAPTMSWMKRVPRRNREVRATAHRSFSSTGSSVAPSVPTKLNAQVADR